MRKGDLRRMEVTRRKFGMLIGAAVAGSLAGAAWLAERLHCRRVLRAIEARRFPGRVRALADQEVREPGRWVG